MKARSALAVLCLVGLGLGSTAAPSGAAFHMMKVREVYAGSLLDPSAEFVELQMYSAGQTILSGHVLTLYDAAGATLECEIPTNVTNGTNQATILFATTQAQTAFGAADFTIPNAFLSGTGGAVCFENVDCVAWGSFSGSTTSPAGAPEPNGIPVGQSIDRRVDIAGGTTTLEAGDDTDDSANDFEAEGESAQPNGPLTLGSLTCAPGGGDQDTEAPNSEITAPKHRTAVTVRDSRNFQGTAKDQGGSAVGKVELALRQKREGGCRWWNGASFAPGGCAEKRFFMAKLQDGTWSYTLPNKLKPSNRTIKSYTLYSRATDGAGNVEAGFSPGDNQARFEVFKPPITCEPGC